MLDEKSLLNKIKAADDKAKSFETKWLSALKRYNSAENAFFSARQSMYEAQTALLNGDKSTALSILSNAIIEANEHTASEREIA